MTPTEYLRKRNIILKGATDLIIGFDNGTEESLIEIMESYHKIKIKQINNMKIKEAISILEIHNKWRRFEGHTTFNTNMVNPKILGIAIDTVVDNFRNPIVDVEKKYTKQDMEKAIEHWGLCKVEIPYIDKFLNKN